LVVILGEDTFFMICYNTICQGIIIAPHYFHFLYYLFF